MKVNISRPLDTGDNQDREVGLGPRNIVWAYGHTNSVGYHGANRGVTKINFRDISHGQKSSDSTQMTIDASPGTAGSHICIPEGQPARSSTNASGSNNKNDSLWTLIIVGVIVVGAFIAA